MEVVFRIWHPNDIVLFKQPIKLYCSSFLFLADSISKTQRADNTNKKNTVVGNVAPGFNAGEECVD